MDLRQISYGTTSAVVTGMALVTGLDAAGSRRASIVTGLLIFALADNLTDSLSIHVYQEAEHLEPRAAFRATLSNFVARLAVTLSFVVIVLLVPTPLAVPTSLLWGAGLLAALTTLLARDRDAPVGRELGRHFALAAAVIVVSQLIGAWVVRVVG